MISEKDYATNQDQSKQVQVERALEPWQPIETAPKDGTKVLVWYSNIYKGICDVSQWCDDRYAKNPRPYWSGRGERMYGTRSYREGKPTHWMPLPAPPEST